MQELCAGKRDSVKPEHTCRRQQLQGLWYSALESGLLAGMPHKETRFGITVILSVPTTSFSIGALETDICSADFIQGKMNLYLI